MPIDDEGDDVTVVADDTATPAVATDSTVGRHDEHMRRTSPDAPRREEREDREVRRDRSRRIEDDGPDSFTPKVQKRINHLTFKMRDAESRAGSLEQENRRLVTQLQEVSGAALQHYESAALARREAAEREAREAYESGDSSKVVEANRKLASAQFAVDSVETVKARNKTTAAEPVVEQQSRTARPKQGYTERTQDWINDNPWFDKDQDARKDAIHVHDRLVRQGFEPDTEDYFRELTKRCRAMFPEHFDGDADDPVDDEPEPARREPRRQAPVAGVSRTTAPASRRVTEIKLSASQLEAAAIAGVTPKAYALSMMRLNKKAT